MMADQYLFLDARFVKAEIAKLVEANPELADDETLRSDMVEAETGADKLLSRIVSEKVEADTMAEAVDLQIKEKIARRDRFRRKSDAMRLLAKSIMRAADISKITLPEASLSITKPRSSVRVHSVDDLPQGYFKTIRQADKTAIKSALEKGEEIPGAELVAGDDGLLVRTK